MLSIIPGPVSFPCKGCNVTFDKKSKLSFHKPCCSENVNIQNANAIENVETDDPNSTKDVFLPEEAVREEPLPVSNCQLIIQDDFHNESLNTSNSETKEDQSVFFGGTGFKMPDNFDLPDEIIQEQLPTGRTSTPIRYADHGDKEKRKEEKHKEEKRKETSSKTSSSKVSQPIPTSSRQSSIEEKTSKGLQIFEISPNTLSMLSIFDREIHLEVTYASSKIRQGRINFVKFISIS